MNKIIIYTKIGCPYCESTKKFFNKLKLRYSEQIYNPNDINYNINKQNLFNYFNYNSFPIIVIGSTFIGGNSDLMTLTDKQLHDLLFY